MRTLGFYLRLWSRLAANAAVRELEYRANFAIGVGEGAVEVALAVLTFALLYQFTDQVAGWSQAQILLLVGVYRAELGVFGLLFTPNLLRLSGYVRDGEMDYFLLRPVSSQFLVSTRVLNLPEGANALIGLALIAYAGARAGVAWTPGGIALACGFAACGLALLYALWFAVVTSAFWFVQVENTDGIFASLFGIAQYPVSFFPGLVRVVLTFVVPVAFATTFPTQALLGLADPRLLLVGLALSAAALYGTHRFWTFALRHYTSASS